MPKLTSSNGQQSKELLLVFQVTRELYQILLTDNGNDPGTLEGAVISVLLACWPLRARLIPASRLPDYEPPPELTCEEQLSLVGEWRNRLQIKPVASAR